MNPKRILLGVALTGTALAFAFAQGPLTPPMGEDPNIGPVNALSPGGLPQATMKTLHQIEPRTAIPGGTSGVVIDQSGAYYLTGNIMVASGDGITINASNVTLDLNGFSILSSASPAEGTGVRLGSALRNLAVRNGNIGGDGLGGSFSGGVYYVSSGFPQPPINLRVADLSVAASEIGISTGSFVATCHVERCLVLGGSVQGIQGGIVKDCVVEGGAISGTIVKDCSATTSGALAIFAQVAENCYASATNGAAINAKCLVNSYGIGGGDNDVIAAGVAQNVWAEGNSGTGDGIEAAVVGNSYGKRESGLGGPSTGDGLKVTIGNGVVGVASGGRGVSGSILQMAQGESTGGNGVQADVISFSRAANSGGIGIVGANVFGSFASGSADKGIYSAMIGNSRADNSGQSGLVSDGGVVTDSVTVNNTGVGAEGSVVSGVWASNNTSMGILSNGSVMNSSVNDNGTVGIQSNVVSFSNSFNSGGIGIGGANVFGSYATESTDKGIYSALIGNSRADYSGQGGLVSDGGVVTDSVSVNNAGVGAEGGVVGSVWALANDQGGIVSSGTVVDSFANLNIGHGVLTRAVSNSVALGNSQTGFRGVVSNNYTTLLAVNSFAEDNVNSGIYSEHGSVVGCIATDNTASGIKFQSGGTVLHSFASSNIPGGIEAGTGVLMGNFTTNNYTSTSGFFPSNYGSDTTPLNRALCNGSYAIGFINVGGLPDK